MEYGFQIAFEAAWDAYKSGSSPIGVSILNARGEVLAVGRNQVHTPAEGGNTIAMHQLAHAEANAILQISEETVPNMHPDIRSYTLYTILEPCPFCFGAIVMGSIRHVKFAARDKLGGAAALNNSLDYIKNKKITVEGPFPQLEIIQVALATCFELESIANPNKRKYSGDLARLLRRSVDLWRTYCPDGTRIGEQMYKDGILKQLAAENKNFLTVKDYVNSAC